MVIIGCGPAGSTTGRIAAEQGLSVLMVDKRQELGTPIQCSGAVSRHALEEVKILPEDEFIHEAIYGFSIYNEDGDKKTIDYRILKPNEYGADSGSNPLGYVVDRRRFDRHLVTLAERAGASVWLKTEGLGMNQCNGDYCSVQLLQYNEPIEVRARVVVAADGLQSRAGKWAGLSTHMRLNELASCLQFVVDHVETEGLLEIITGHKWAPGGYAWIFPKGNGYAEIGLGVTRNHTDLNPQEHLDHFIKKSFFQKRFANCKILEIQGGGVPLAPPLKTQYADHMVIVGDAARQVNPITGGGIHTALSGGRIAGNFLVDFIKEGHKPKKEQLKSYQDLWLNELGNKMWQLYREKNAIFKIKNIAKRNEQLFETMSSYFSPESIYKKI